MGTAGEHSVSIGVSFVFAKHSVVPSAYCTVLRLLLCGYCYYCPVVTIVYFFTSLFFICTAVATLVVPLY